MHIINLQHLKSSVNTRPLRHVLTIIAVMLSITAFAQSFQYKGLDYTVIDGSSNTCITRPGYISDGNFVAGNLYNGALEIPSSVSDGEKEYTVVGIGEYGFCNSDITEIILPETVTSIGNNAFQECQSLKAISLPKSLTAIGTYAFSGCSVLTEMTLPEKLTEISGSTFASCLKLTKVSIPESIVDISKDAFFNCVSLKSVTLPQSLTRLGDRAFWGCRSLATISIPDGINNIPYCCFSGCSSLVSVSFPESLTQIRSSAFSGCTSLTSVSLPSGVSNISDRAFKDCIKLESIDLPQTLTNIGYETFSGCRSLKSVVLPESLTSIESSAFRNCSSLTDITFPSSLTSINWGAFTECGKLTSISLPEGLTSISGYAFEQCVGLTSVSLPASLNSSKWGVFSACPNLQSVTCNASEPSSGVSYDFFNEETYSLSTLYMPNASLDAVKAIYPWNCFKHIVASDGSVEPESLQLRENEFVRDGIIYAILDSEAKTCKTRDGEGYLYLAGNTRTGDLEIPQKVSDGKNTYTVVEIGSYSFCGNKIQAVSLPSTVKTIREGAFYGCSDLEYISLPKKLENIGSSAFKGCSKLESIKLPDSLVSLEWDAFYGCTGLGALTLSKSITSVQSRTFYGCNSLASVTIPKSVTYIGGSAFANCSSLSSVSFAESLTNIDSQAFLNCSSLTSIKLPNTLNELGYGAFYGCSALEDITFPKAIATINENVFGECVSLTALKLPSSLNSIGNQAFLRCTNLNYISFPRSLTTIRDGAFQECSALNELSLPKSLTKIGESGFNACMGLVSVTFPESLDSIGPNSFVHCIGLNRIDFANSVSVIEQSAFFGCYRLTSVSLPKSVREIGENAFYNCYNILSVTLPQGLASIGNGAFRECWNLKAVTYNAANPVEAPEDMFDTSTYQRATLFMPYAYRKDIMSVSPWNYFQKIEARDGALENSMEFEYEGIKYSIIDLKAKTCKTKDGTYNESNWSYEPANNVEGEIVIPSVVSNDYEEYTVVGIGTASFKNNAGLTSITLPESVISIGDAAFCSCENLGAVSLPVSLTNINQEAFRYCKSLDSIILPDSLSYIGWSVFAGCSSLSDVSFPSSLITIGGYAFEECTSLSSISLPASLKELYWGAFNHCDKLTEVNYYAEVPVEGYDDSFGVKTYDNATLIMPNATMEKIRSVNPWNKFKNVQALDGSMVVAGDFEYDGIMYSVVDPWQKTCRTKEGIYDETIWSYIAGNSVEGDVVIPSVVSDGYDEYTVVEIGEYGFCQNLNLTSVSLPETVNSIGFAAFSGCENMASINIPEGVVNIPNETFQRCRSLTSITLPESLTSIEWFAFYGCSGLTTVSFPSSLTTIGGFAFKECTSLTSFSLPESITNICQDAFIKCDNLVEVYYYAEAPVQGQENIFGNQTYEKATLVMPNATMESIGATVPWNKFLNVQALDGSLVSVGDFEYEGVLYTVVNPWEKTCKTKDGQDWSKPGNSFEGDLVIPATVTDGNDYYTVVRIGEFGFCGNNNLVSITLPETLTSIGRTAFWGCESLTTVTIPSSVSVLEDEAFGWCSNLTSVTLPEKMSYIDASVFNNCRSLVSVTMPVYLQHMDSYVFEECSSLETIRLPESISGISWGTFRGCSSLTSIFLPNSLVQIYYDAFERCNRLTSMVFDAGCNIDPSYIGFVPNPNMVVYLNDANSSMASLDRNVAIYDNSTNEYLMDNLVLAPGYSFSPAYPFTSRRSSMTKEFRNLAPTEGNAGWESIVLPFAPTEVSYDGRVLSPVDGEKDQVKLQDYWLYEADPDGVWKAASEFQASVPYMIALPAQGGYESFGYAPYNVTFTNDQSVKIAPETTAPYAVNWAFGREFRSLWLTLDENERNNAMGIYTGYPYYYSDLVPGSAFYSFIEPKPLEAYVTRIGDESNFVINCLHSDVKQVEMDDDLDISVESGSIVVRSGYDRTLEVYTTAGVRARVLDIKAGETYIIDNLTKGIYIVAGRKIIVK